MAAVRCSPIASADGSLNDRSSFEAAVEAGAGEGVAGGCEVEEATCAGAAGGAGVPVAALAGVAGSAGFEGAALGYSLSARSQSSICA